VLRIKRPVPAYLALVVGLLGAFGLGNYYPGLYLGELSAICVAGMYGWLAISTRMQMRDRTLVFCFAVGLGAFAMIYAYVFSLRTGAPVLPSMLAQRDLTFFLLAPIVYILHLRGWELKDFQHVFLSAALLILANYALVHATIDLKSWDNSNNPYEQAMVSYDEVRGYRLKGPWFVFLFLVLYFARRAVSSRYVLVVLGRLALAMLALAPIVVNAPRSTMLAVATALVFHAAFLSRQRRVVGLSFFITAAVFTCVVALPYANHAIMETFAGDWSYIVRTDSAAKAWDYIVEYPIFGLGQESYQSISYHDLLGGEFYPSDIGLLGVAFKYGLLGVLTYVVLGVWVTIGLVRLLWAGNLSPSRGAFLWALTVICLSFLFASPLQMPFIDGDGLGIGAIAWGLLMSHRRDQKVIARARAARNISPPFSYPEGVHR
jgi:hypothetical protein